VEIISNTVYQDVVDVFHSYVMSKYEFPDLLEKQFFINSLAEYELEIATLGFNFETNEFPIALPSYTVMTLGLIMYINSLTRELSRVMKLNSITGKDVSLTGMDATKRVTKSELDSELSRANILLNKQKNHCFDN